MGIRAAQYGFDQKGPVQLYLEMMLLLGSDFDNNPKIAWARETLTQSGLSQTRRADLLFFQTNDYFSALSNDASLDKNQCPLLSDPYASYADERINSACVECRQGIVKDAYFARAIVTDAKESVPVEHPVEKGETASRLAVKYCTTTALIAERNNLAKVGSIRIGQKLEIIRTCKIGDNIAFERLDQARLTDEVYLIVETENLRNEALTVTAHQGKAQLLGKLYAPLSIINGQTNIDGKVGAFADDNSERYKNSASYQDYWIQKIQLTAYTSDTNDVLLQNIQPTANTSGTNNQWSDKIAATDDKNTGLYLSVAHPNLMNPLLEHQPEKLFKLTPQCNCGKGYGSVFSNQVFGGTRYGPVYEGVVALSGYSSWDLVDPAKPVTEKEIELLTVVSMNESDGKSDSVQSYDSAILSAGPIHKIIDSEGKGQFAALVSAFKQSNAEKYDELFACCGWTVENDKMYYQIMDEHGIAKKITGKVLKDQIRAGYTSANHGRRDQDGNLIKFSCKPLNPIIYALNDADFQRVYLNTAIKQLRNVLNTPPIHGETTYPAKLGGYLTSQLGRATAFDQFVNREAYVKEDFGKALNYFFNLKEYENVERDPAKWGNKHQAYEKIIVAFYSINRRIFGGKALKRYNILKDYLKKVAGDQENNDD